MINFLSIKNYALIDDISVDFDDGLTCITGETGAGKSILLGALALLLGKRADLSSVKNPDKKCIIEGQFEISSYGLAAFFQENDIDFETITIIRREILPSGKSRAFVNDSPVVLSILAQLGTRLIDIHSQHQTLSLGSNAFQFEVIDAFANSGTHLNSYKKSLEHFNALKSEIALLESQKAEAQKELDYNSFLLSELDQAQLETLDQEALEDEYKSLSHVEEVKEALAYVLQSLNNDEIGILQNLRDIRQRLSVIVDLSPAFKSLYERLDSSLIEMEDVSQELEGQNENTLADPARLETVNGMLQNLYTLHQKHKLQTVAELITLRNSLQEKIDLTFSAEQQLETLSKQFKELKDQLDEEAKILHDKRVVAIPELVKQLENILLELGLPNARFFIEAQETDHYYATGKDQLSFLFTANKGIAFGEIKKVASGGELSRVMLAIKAILANYSQLPTIIFDEIDTGVSGEIANKMANIMHSMSSNMQVFSITHLPQIAAKGRNHIKVYKEDVDHKTSTHLKVLSHEQRLIEIAQMLGGEQITTSAMAHAKALLN